ncbi:predicted protein [Plenodomus lingam JN3]|uniref:Predicted protein n=1 Tax=Leptosphaeria maculans (strain JN3 / isolate v23.1.3 / race Av1-4-5-6-7-8) TaxID=985895 RepID=E5A9S4_LEPMJ|nr:predicted protein [Plenodomus lingam JN3]CBY00415.1 predicted protein [Plenodomus lingam JN3]
MLYRPRRPVKSMIPRYNKYKALPFSLPAQAVVDIPGQTRCADNTQILQRDRDGE